MPCSMPPLSGLTQQDYAMKYNLPDFETLIELSKTDPRALDRIKQEASAALIDEAPAKYQQRLRGLQFQIDMEVRKAKSPMEGCIRISQLMQESLSKLRSSLNNISQDQPLHLVVEAPQPISAEILPFRQYS